MFIHFYMSLQCQRTCADLPLLHMRVQHRLEQKHAGAAQESEALAQEVRDAEQVAAGLRRELTICAGSEQQYALRGTTQVHLQHAC